MFVIIGAEISLLSLKRLMLISAVDLVGSNLFNSDKNSPVVSKVKSNTYLNCLIAIMLGLVESE